MNFGTGSFEVRSGLNSVREGSTAGFCERGDEIWGYIKAWKFLVSRAPF